MAHLDLGGTWHESSYRLTEIYDVTVPPGWVIALDPQPYAEVVLVQQGRLRVELGTDRVVVSPGQLVVLLPGAARVTEALGEPVEFVGFGFRIELLGSIEMSGLLGIPVLIEQPADSLTGLIRTAVERGAGESAAAALTARAYAELATAELVAAYGDVGHVRRVRTRPEIEAALTLMEQDLSGDLDVPSLARAANMSPKHFATCFRNLVGVPPMAYLQAMRLSRARAALARTDQTTTAIAASHGFADAAHFSRAFKRRYGLAPTQFRRNLLRDNTAGLWDKPRRAAPPHDGVSREESCR
ncbi:MAG: AraC family transcriptional regulator [Nocardioides sp.]|uniref:helix-turn-helix domain-containing protein n=1 Tax=Nocardioides sp. TaxID=35761 RepID=UPI0039E630BB